MIQSIVVKLEDGREVEVSRAVLLTVREEADSLFVSFDMHGCNDGDLFAVFATAVRIAREMGVDDELIGKAVNADEEK